MLAGSPGFLQADPAVVGCLDDLLGSVYALVLAKEGGFIDRPGQPIQITPVQKRATSSSPQVSD
jgi:hypothetical protein